MCVLDFLPVIGDLHIAQHREVKSSLDHHMIATRLLPTEGVNW
jgi:hypothetical protein